MRSDKIVISGTGCALADFLYTGVSFESGNFRKYLSHAMGDGGLSPGKLVFTEELEKFAGLPYPEILKNIIGNRKPDAYNVGGPSLVSLIHASQVLDKVHFETYFFGIAGKDNTAKTIFGIVNNTPLNIENYISSELLPTPSTDVFSDPDFANGNGERCFVNNIGAAMEYKPLHLDKSFFNAHIVCFGGTALVPHIHDNLTSLLTLAKEKDCATIVNTVYDFRNEKINPGAPWPLVKSIDDYEKIDVLIMDHEEALKISGQKNIQDAAAFFASTKVSSFIITNGADSLYAESNGGFFQKTGLLCLPVSEKVTSNLRTISGLKGDTTGCGDNFAGGIIASVATQIRNSPKEKLNFIEAISWGVAAGGFACFIKGGTFEERIAGEKKDKVSAIQKEYLLQIGK